MRIAVSGAHGRLGRALVDALAEAPFVGPVGPIAWHRPEFDLDVPERFGELLARDRPEVVIHAAAWTDVDGCARDPDLARLRNGAAVGVLAEACRATATDLIVISTNEVFSGDRTDGCGYGVGDPTSPPNPYGASKRAGELAAEHAYGDAGGTGPHLAIVRTAWLYGPPGADFPSKIASAAETARATGRPLRLVEDEVGSPTYAPDLAEAIVELISAGEVAGIHHLVNGGAVSRRAWAEAVLAGLGVAVETIGVPGSTWPRASTPPAWAVLAQTGLPTGVPMRPWREALADYLPLLRRQLREARG
jgi:dTDP-4-dehydrorhamnose reductase